VESAEKSLDVARLNLLKARILAPFNGVIVSKKIERGGFAAAGAPIVEMIGSARLKAVLEIPQSYRGKLGRIQKGEFLVRELGLSFTQGSELAKRIRVIPDANIYSGNIRVQVDLPRPDPALFPGLTLEAKLDFDTRRNVLHVPSVALVITEQGTVVYIMTEGKAERVPVKAFKEREGFVEIEDFTHKFGPDADLILRGSGAVFPGVSVFPTNLEPKAEPPVDAARKNDAKKEAGKSPKPPET
jgi:RND family efflux transporter MFP subunit